MARLAYCFPTAFQDPVMQASPGMPRYSNATKIFGFWVMPVDRTGLVTTPIDSISLFPMPAYRVFTKSYEEICNDRAHEILSHAEKLGATLYVMYSGGIDSTCLLISLLKQATPEQKKHIVVLLSHESIAENPRFYTEHIRGKLRVEPSIGFPNLIGGDDILLSAEHNDLVMGNASISSLITEHGPTVLHKPYDRDVLIGLFEKMLSGDRETAHFYFDLFKRLSDAAPMEIRTNFDFMWWFNFTMKWQACFSFILFFTLPQHAPRISKEYLDTHFISFYNTEEFQLWSMNNLDKRIKDSWKSYKWVIKDIIYDYTKDAEYRDNKTKVRSLPIVLKQLRIHFPFLDEYLRFRTEIPPRTFLKIANDFI